VRPELFLDAWNTNCRHLPKVKDLSASRRKKLASRASEGLTLDQFIVGVKSCASNEFLSGGGPSGWQATFDWIIANDSNLLRVIEGSYGDIPDELRIEESNKNGTDSALEAVEPNDFWGQALPAAV